MGFGFVQNLQGLATNGFNPNAMFRGFNLGDGIKSNVAKFLGKEFQYTEVFSFLVRANQELTTFDWNQTDAEIKKQYEDINTEIAGNWGAVIGRGIGSTTAIGLGSGSALLLPKISGARLAQKVLEAGSKQAREDLIDESSDAINTTKGLAGKLLFLEGFIQFRKLIKKQPLPLLEGLYGKETAYFIKNGWGEPNGESFKIADKIEERIESIKSNIVKEFVTEALEGFGDSFIDTGFVIAQEFDDSLRQYQLSRSNVIEPDVIQVFPIEENLDESFIIQSNDQVEIQQQTTQILNTWRVINNRDVGQIVAQQIEEYEMQPQLRRLEVTFKSLPRPPFMMPTGERAKETTVTIPQVKRGLSWQKIKSTFNNNNIAYTWGDKVAVLKFVNKRKIRVFLDKGDSAESLLKDWADLSDAGEIKTITISDYLRQPSSSRDTATPMYAIYAKLINSNINSLSQTIPDPPIASYRFDLWVDDAPNDFSTYFN